MEDVVKLIWQKVVLAKADLGRMIKYRLMLETFVWFDCSVPV